MSVEESEKKADESSQRIVATSVHETANLSDSDEPVCTTGPYGEEPSLSSDLNMKYEPALISDSTPGLFDVNGVTARSRYRNVYRGVERRIEFRPNAKQNILRCRKI